MTKSNSIESYPHCKEIWDEAYASPSGSILVTLPDGMSKSDQATLVGDLLHYRVLVRKNNTKFFPEGHPSYMTSIFDPFRVTKVTDPEKGYAVRINRRTTGRFKIEVEDHDVTI